MLKYPCFDIIQNNSNRKGTHTHNDAEKSVSVKDKRNTCKSLRFWSGMHKDVTFMHACKCYVFYFICRESLSSLVVRNSIV